MRTPALLPLALLTASLSHAAIIQSTFNSGSEGWTVAGDGADTSVTYIASGCNPGGCIQRTDQTSGYMHFSAPAAFLGNLTVFQGGTLSYDLLQTTSSSDTSWFYRLVIQGAGLYLLATVEMPPNTTGWVHQATTLTASNFIVIPSLDAYTGPAASQGQLDAVLASVTGLFITGDLVSGDLTSGGADLASLDNVALETPEPGTASLVAASGLLVVLFRRYRKM